MYTITLKSGKSYQVTYLDESFRNGVFTLAMTLDPSEQKPLPEYAAAFSEKAVSEITIQNEKGEQFAVTGYKETSVSRMFENGAAILIRVTKEQA